MTARKSKVAPEVEGPTVTSLCAAGSFDLAIEVAIGTDETILPTDYAALVAYVREVADRGETVPAALAYGVRLRGVTGDADGAASITRLAGDLVTPSDVYAAATHKDVQAGKRAAVDVARDRKRVSLAQWATAYGYLVENEAPVTGDTYRDARRIYNGGAASRKRFTALSSLVLAAPADSKAGVLATVASECAALKGTTSKAPAPAPAPTEPDGEPVGSTRVARPNDGGDVASYTVQWMRDLAALVAAVGTPEDGAQVVLNDAQGAALLDMLATLGTLVPASVTA